MKMKIGAALPEDYVVRHEDLAEAATSLIAHALLPLFTENMPEGLAKANAEGIVTELAYLFDEGEITLGGRRYRPCLAFVDDAGALVPGAEALKNWHALVGAPFDIDDAAQIEFQSAEFTQEP